MPEFQPPPKKRRTNGNGGPPSLPPATIPDIGTFEPKCHVCQSSYRRAIDRMVALGTSYSEISRIFGGEIDRRSISNHAKEHLNYEEAAIRRILEREAEAAQENLEDGIRGQLSRRAYLEIALQKALEGLLNGDTSVEPKDALAIIEKLDRLDTQGEGAALDEIRLQFNAFMQAIREISMFDIERIKQPMELQQLIFNRTREILARTPELAPPPPTE
jgi:hypothetical protein